MKNGGLMKKSRQNEPNKLTIFGVHHRPPAKWVAHPLSN